MALLLFIRFSVSTPAKPDIQKHRPNSIGRKLTERVVHNKSVKEQMFRLHGDKRLK